MPPFDAYETEDCQPPHAWKDDPRLTDDEKALLRAWAENGAPEGDGDAAAPIPDRIELDIQGPVLELVPDEGYSTSGMTDEFMCVSIDPALLEDGWLTGLQVIPGNDQVVHHVVVFTDPHAESASWGDQYTECFSPSFTDSQALAVWVPGSPPTEYPEGSAITARPSSASRAT